MPPSIQLYDLPAEEAAEIPTVAYSLKDALAELDADREFLTAGAVARIKLCIAFISAVIAIPVNKMRSG